MHQARCNPCGMNHQKRNLALAANANDTNINTGKGNHCKYIPVPNVELQWLNASQPQGHAWTNAANRQPLEGCNRTQPKALESRFKNLENPFPKHWHSRSLPSSKGERHPENASTKRKTRDGRQICGWEQNYWDEHQQPRAVAVVYI